MEIISSGWNQKKASSCFLIHPKNYSFTIGYNPEEEIVSIN